MLLASSFISQRTLSSGQHVVNSKTYRENVFLELLTAFIILIQRRVKLELFPR